MLIHVNIARNSGFLPSRVKLSEAEECRDL